jgi:hypothetical protein
VLISIDLVAILLTPVHYLLLSMLKHDNSQLIIGHGHFYARYSPNTIDFSISSLNNPVFTAKKGYLFTPKVDRNMIILSL